MARRPSGGDRLERIRAELAAEREALQGELACVRDPGCAPVDPGSRDALEAALRAAIREVEEALERIRRGVFGRCEDCGRSIDPRRLRAFPRARRCVPCQRAEDGRVAALRAEEWRRRDRIA